MVERIRLLALAKGERVCNKCHGEGYYFNKDIPLPTDQPPGYYETFPPRYICRCLVYKNWWRTFSTNVPPHDQSILLGSISPSSYSTLALNNQAAVIEQIRKAPTESYAFYGPAGTGKTTLGVALYDAALWNSPESCQPATTPFVWRVSAKLLMEDFVAFATSKEIDGKVAKEPRVNRRAIIKAVQRGFRPCLFLEEIDKVLYTQFKSDSLWELFDAGSTRTTASWCSIPI